MPAMEQDDHPFGHIIETWPVTKEQSCTVTRLKLTLLGFPY